MINSRRLYIFAAVCESGSIAAASMILNMTQPAISMQISQLEDEMGIKLFDRSRRPMRLTQTGRNLAERAIPAITELDIIINELTTVTTKQEMYRLGAIPTVLTNLLPRALVNLRNKLPKLTVHVTSGLSGRLMRQVGQGELDGAIIHKPDTLGTEFNWTGISNQAILIHAPPDSTELSPAALFANHSYIRFYRKAWVSTIIEPRFEELGLQPRTIAEIESIDSIHVLVRYGLGISVLPVETSGDLVPHGIRLVNFGTPDLYRSIGLLTARDSRKHGLRQAIYTAFDDARKKPD